MADLQKIKCSKCEFAYSHAKTGLCPDCSGDWADLNDAEKERNRAIIQDYVNWGLGEEVQGQRALPLKLYKRDKPNGCYESGCPLATKGQGFALGCGDPTTADFAVILETIGKDEAPFRLTPAAQPRGLYDTEPECAAEIAVRRRDYPVESGIDEKFLVRGVPVVGKAGALLFQWLFQPLGVTRPRLFIDSTLRCLPAKSGRGGLTAPYPTGIDRKQAERCCRQYDRLHLFKPDTLVFSIHPASLSREVTPLPLVLKDCEKARDFAAQGRRVALLLGGKAVKAFARYGESITKWRGDYCVLPAKWHETYKTAFDCVAAVTGKTKKRFDDLEAQLLGGSDVDLKKAGKKRTRKVAKKEKK